MWRLLVADLLFALAGIILVVSLMLAFFEYQAPGIVRSLLHYVGHRILRRPDKPSEFPAGEFDNLGGPHFCPSHCDADADLPGKIVADPYEAHKELPKFRRVVRTRCRHAGEYGIPVHCHDVRELHWWERNWIVYGILALVRLRLNAESCPEYMRGILADHLHPVPGPVEHNVYFINGVYTNRKSASRQRQYVESFFGAGVDVRLLYNRIDLRLDPLQLSHDYTWGISSSPATTPFVSQPALAAYAILLDGFRRGTEIAFVGFSGGTLHIAMAIRAFRTVPAHQIYLRQKVRVIAAANLIHRSSHLDFAMSLRQFEPHVDRQDAFARAFTGGTYTFDDGRTFDLGTPEWRKEINVGLWAKAGTELLLHEDVARYHSIENNYLREEPWKAPGEKDKREIRHVKHDALGERVVTEITPGPIKPKKKRSPRAKKK